MSTVLGRLEPVELREVWASESVDFTPWLAREVNIKILSDTIGLELEVEATEKEVGPFRADILCKDTAEEERWVLIENQLERTDHTHLGQLLTYAAGLQTVTIVWIAERFTEEHRAALDWLNEITDDRFTFFGLEIELWRIGDSPVAPKFNIVCKPNDWSKSVSTGKKTIATGGLSEVRQTQLDYWSAFHELLRSRKSSVKGEMPQPHHNIHWALGRSNFWLSTICLVRDSGLAVKLMIGGPDARAYFKRIEARKAAIEADIGSQLEWYAPENVKRCAVILHRDADPSDRTKWPELMAWQAEILERFYHVMRPIVMSLELNDDSTGEQ